MDRYKVGHMSAQITLDALLRKKKDELLDLAQSAKLDVDAKMTKTVIAGRLYLSSIPDRKSVNFMNLKKNELELLCVADGASLKNYKTKQALVDRICRGSSPEPLTDIPKDVIGTIIQKINNPLEERRIAKILNDAYSLRRIAESIELKSFQVWLPNLTFTIYREDSPSYGVFEATVGAWMQLLIYGRHRYLKNNTLLLSPNGRDSVQDSMRMRITDHRGDRLDVKLNAWGTHISVNDNVIANLVFIIEYNRFGVQPKYIYVSDYDVSRIYMLRWLKLLNVSYQKGVIPFKTPKHDAKVNTMIKVVRKEIKQDGESLQTEIDDILKTGFVLPKTVKLFKLTSGKVALYSETDLTNAYGYPMGFIFDEKENHRLVPLARPSRDSTGTYYFVSNERK